MKQPSTKINGQVVVTADTLLKYVLIGLRNKALKEGGNEGLAALGKMESVEKIYYTVICTFHDGSNPAYEIAITNDTEIIIYDKSISLSGNLHKAPNEYTEFIKELSDRLTSNKLSVSEIRDAIYMKLLCKYYHELVASQILVPFVGYEGYNSVEHGE